VWEIGHAKALNKPIVMVMEPGNIHDHIFLTHSSGYVVDTSTKLLSSSARFFHRDSDDEGRPHHTSSFGWAHRPATWR